jgi:polyisoprenoid-binding protein YceI
MLRGRNVAFPQAAQTAEGCARIVRRMTTNTAAVTGSAPTTLTRWAIDPGHSAVGFSVRHLMITNVRGEFGTFRGDVFFDASDPEATRVEATIDVASINTREAKRDADLRSGLFFDAESHPTLKFVSKGARASSSGDLEVTGDLTIRGVTRPVALSVREISAPQTDMRGLIRIGATASAQIKRSDFGMTWNKALDTGGVVVGDLVSITLDLSLVKAG